MKHFQIVREIGIDAGHRVPDHYSKCKNQHGHRYTIQAVCTGELAVEGSEAGMVMDFGFLKELMMEIIDNNCDHANILWIHDPLLAYLVDIEKVKANFSERGYYRIEGKGGWLYVMDSIPTAENLARHWFNRLAPLVTTRSLGRASLSKIIVWETPNCSASYPAS
jgi:6-pyruvoyltetrahydropterin/6-carboxytetrahydropterin synthase